MTINDYMDLTKELGFYERMVTESYIDAMVNAVRVLMRNEKNDRIDRCERKLYDVMEPFCTDRDIKLSELREVLDNEATRRIYVQSRFRKGVA